ncbi:MAG: low molecular weight protein-tyrosine-phosphatase [Robiginitomaculum sp.]|nr:low molecular weight protein-tyrosine-phosphatase [Robiginitomaculum sp.]MDQ7076513.1 low molecular weight protein-tyrosine-phosphatase [Robiginitomaculum sp.]
MKHRVLFVCLGNICRSPSAEAVLRHQARQQGLSVDVDSAGTGNWHVGQPPDARAIAAAAARGIDMHSLRARQVCVADFTRFTHMFAMDQSNLADLMAMCPEGGIMPTLFLGPATHTPPGEVPDPYYGGAQGFEHMLDLIEAAASGFLQTLN